MCLKATIFKRLLSLIFFQVLAFTWYSCHSILFDGAAEGHSRYWLTCIYRSYWLLSWSVDRKTMIGFIISNFPSASFVPVEYVHPIALAQICNSLFHIQITVTGQGDNIYETFLRGCYRATQWRTQEQDFHMCEQGWSLISTKRICTSCPWPITLALFSCWPSNISSLGADQENLALTLWSLMYSLFCFLRRKEGDFSWQTQTSQEAGARWLRCSKVDLTQVHIWVGWLN